MQLNDIISVNPGVMRILKIAFLFLTVGHFIACALYWASVLSVQGALARRREPR